MTDANGILVSTEFRVLAAREKVKLLHDLDVDALLDRRLNRQSLNAYLVCLQKAFHEQGSTVNVWTAMSKDILTTVFALLNSSCIDDIHRATLNPTCIRQTEDLFNAHSFIPVQVRCCTGRIVLAEYLHRNLLLAELGAMVQARCPKATVGTRVGSHGKPLRGLGDGFLHQLDIDNMVPNACSIGDLAQCGEQSTLGDIAAAMKVRGMTNRRTKPWWPKKYIEQSPLSFSMTEDRLCGVCDNAGYNACVVQAGYLNKGTDPGRHLDTDGDPVDAGLNLYDGDPVFDIHSKRQCGRCWQQLLHVTPRR